MAKFDRHCDDCMRLLGLRYENVNRYLDTMFAEYGPMHRRQRHHWNGVHTVLLLWGHEAAKAAIIHIVRDCGHVPNERDYQTGKVDPLGTACVKYGTILIANPDALMYDGQDEKAFDKFRKAVEKEWEKLSCQPN
jgi:hypothetical protein